MTDQNQIPSRNERSFNVKKIENFINLVQFNIWEILDLDPGPIQLVLVQLAWSFATVNLLIVCVRWTFINSRSDRILIRNNAF